MSLPDVVSREQWLEARRRLLAQEKEYTRSQGPCRPGSRRRPHVHQLTGMRYPGPVYSIPQEGFPNTRPGFSSDLGKRYFLARPCPLARPSLARHGGAAGIAAMTASGSRFSVLALVLALCMFGHVVRVADRLPLRAPALAGSRPGSGALAPRCAALCKIAMGLTIGYMLILML